MKENNKSMKVKTNTSSKPPSSAAGRGAPPETGGKQAAAQPPPARSKRDPEHDPRVILNPITSLLVDHLVGIFEVDPIPQWQIKRSNQSAVLRFDWLRGERFEIVERVLITLLRLAGTSYRSCSVSGSPLRFSYWPPGRYYDFGCFTQAYLSADLTRLDRENPDSAGRAISPVEGLVEYLSASENLVTLSSTQRREILYR
jgi:hypothetical protein